MKEREFLNEALDCLSKGDIDGFFTHLDDNIEWFIESAHPATGRRTMLNSKPEIRQIFDRFAEISKLPLWYRIRKIYETDEKNVFVVQLDALSGAGGRIVYENRQCWIMKVESDPLRIISVVGYIDSLMIFKFYKEYTV